MTSKADKASLALENYLDDLFMPDEMTDVHQTTDSKPNVNHHSRKFQLGKENLSSSIKHQHQIERVERLLDDYNKRQNNAFQTATKTENNISLLRPVLEPETTAEIIQDTGENQTQEINHQQPVLNHAQTQFRQERFQALLFEVAGMNIAVPLISLGGISRIDKEITQLFGKPDWFMGITPGLNGNVNVVDSCRWIMPERYGEAKTKGLNYAFIIMLEDSQWGLACSHVQNAISVEPENIKWRSESSKRPWLAGMLIEERCALLDVQMLLKLLMTDNQR